MDAKYCALRNKKLTNIVAERQPGWCKNADVIPAQIAKNAFLGHPKSILGQNGPNPTVYGHQFWYTNAAHGCVPRCKNSAQNICKQKCYKRLINLTNSHVHMK